NGKVDRATLRAGNLPGISPQKGLVASGNQELPSDAATRKRKLFEYLLEEEEGIDLSKTKIAPAAEHEAMPLSFAQQRLWFLDQLQPGSPTYNIPGAFRIRGPLNVAALRQSIHEVVRRHEALRTTFVVASGRLAQVISSVVALAPSLIDPRDLPRTQREAAIQGFITEEAGRGFDLQNGPLLRVGLIRLAADEYVLALTMHHIVSDGWSLGVFIREIRLLYETFASGRPSPLPNLPIQYKDFSTWQREYLAGDVLESRQAYWRHQLGGELPLLSVPSDHTRRAVQSLRGATLSRMFSRELSQALRTLSGHRAATFFMTLLSAFNVLMYRYSGQCDLILGTPVANRNRAEFEWLIGLFVNTLVLRADLSGDPTFERLLDQIKEVVLGASANQDMPFDLLLDALHQDRDMSHMPLFQMMFSLNDAVPRLDMAGLTLDPMPVGGKTAKFDLTLFMEEADRGLSASLEYNSDLFEAATVQRMLVNFETLLCGIAEDPACRISDLPLLTGAERAQLTTLSADRVVYPANAGIPAAFELHAAQALEDIQVYVLDKRLGLLPFGTVGEVYVAGGGLPDYLNQPQLAAERLVPHPWSTQKGQRLLKTGDVARVRASREVEYLGRASDQVQFRGHRIELNDIEPVLNRHHNVRESIVAAPEDQTGRRHLTAYIITAGGGDLSTGDLQRHLADELPKYMIPEQFVMLESWPLTEDGKLDRAALTALRVPAVEATAGYVEPQTEIEKKIAAVWRELLKAENVGLNDNFFDLGGNSLLMARACGELRTALDRDISVIDMFRHPSVGALARYLSQPQPERPSLEEVRRRTETRKTLTRQRGLGGRRAEIGGR
ncbi:MAG TPA: condensation domain-containing protein, partial [Blastocatellia bacterium]|nr:condensation domain-containing protein [Blastocatellia bacterium]